MMECYTIKFGSAVSQKELEKALRLNIDPACRIDEVHKMIGGNRSAMLEERKRKEMDLRDL